MARSRKRGRAARFEWMQSIIFRKKNAPDALIGFWNDTNKRRI